MGEDLRAPRILSPLAKHRPRREWLTAMNSSRFTFCFDLSLSAALSVFMGSMGLAAPASARPIAETRNESPQF
jgi:hypothetical protein